MIFNKYQFDGSYLDKHLKINYTRMHETYVLIQIKVK